MVMGWDQKRRYKVCESLFKIITHFWNIFDCFLRRWNALQKQTINIRFLAQKKESDWITWVCPSDFVFSPRHGRMGAKTFSCRSGGRKENNKKKTMRESDQSSSVIVGDDESQKQQQKIFTQKNWVVSMRMRSREKIATPKFLCISEEKGAAPISNLVAANSTRLSSSSLPHPFLCCSNAGKVKRHAHKWNKSRFS